jgi:hypothetical protein
VSNKVQFYSHDPVVPDRFATFIGAAFVLTAAVVVLGVYTCRPSSVISRIAERYFHALLNLVPLGSNHLLKPLHCVTLVLRNQVRMNLHRDASGGAQAKGR